MKRTSKLVAELMQEASPAAKIRTLRNKELRGLLAFLGRAATPRETIFAAAIVEAAQRFLTKRGKTL